MCPDALSGAARLIIDLGAIAANWRLLGAQSRAASCAAVVKADGYGLGATPVARRLYREGCRDFFVALLDEGLALQADLPPDTRIYVLNGLNPGSEELCAAAGLIPVLNSLDQVDRWQVETKRAGRRLPAALQADTGMRRLGLAEAEWQTLAAAPERMHCIDVVLVMSHLACADQPGDPMNRAQLASFQGFRSLWPDARASFANSSGVFLGADFQFDLLRPGAALFGVAPTLERANPMHPVLRMQGRLVQWRTAAIGDHVGYNRTWRAARPSRIATIGVGYADGYPRALSNLGAVAISGHRAPLVGRVSMDTITADVTDVPLELLHAGSWVDLIHDHQDLNALAALAEGSAYEVLTGLGRRFERVYLNEHDSPQRRPGGAGAPLQQSAAAATA